MPPRFASSGPLALASTRTCGLRCGVRPEGPCASAPQAHLEGPRTLDRDGATGEGFDEAVDADGQDLGAVRGRWREAHFVAGGGRTRTARALTGGAAGRSGIVADPALHEVAHLTDGWTGVGHQRGKASIGAQFDRNELQPYVTRFDRRTHREIG